MHKNALRTLIILSLLLISGFPFGCGNKIDTIPDGSTITIDPPSVAFANIFSDVIQNFTVTVRYPDGTPIPYAYVQVEGSFAIPNGMGLYQFYYYPFGTDNPSNVAVPSGFTAQTREDGTYTFSIVIFGTSLFDPDNIRVRAGTASVTAEVKVTQS